MMRFLYLSTGAILTFTALAISSGVDLFGQSTAIASIAFTQDDHKVSAKLTDFVVVAATKTSVHYSPERFESRFALVVNDVNNSPVDTIYVADPFHIRYEYADFSEIGSVEIAESRSDLLIRFPYTTVMHRIDVYDLRTDRSGVLLEKLILTKPGN